MREIEVKAKITSLDQTKEKLVSLGCTFSDPIEQFDTIFVSNDYGKFDEFQTKKNIIRIRHANNKFIFTLKQSQTQQLDALEHETEIADPEEMKEALKLLGYNEIVKVHKIRRIAKYNSWTICLDSVTNLGSFIEVEKLTQEADVNSVLAELNAFLTQFGITESDKITEGYDTLMYRLLLKQ